MFKRPYYRILSKRLKEKRRFIQILAGSRQVGKTTLIQQILKEIGIPSHYASADAMRSDNTVWIEQQWEVTRFKLKQSMSKHGFILVIDEIQKIPSWTEMVKKLWDQDTKSKIPIKVVLLGSSPLLIKDGLKESLAGRFEVIYLPHWSFSEMKNAFNFNIEQYVFFGGYPGAAPLIRDEARWKNYINDSLIETTISRDILMLSRVDKPALLRRVFELGCSYSGQILSLNKILGQLQEAGNTTTISHYIELLSQAGMLKGLFKYSAQKVRQRASSPKFQVYNNSLITAQENYTFKDAQLNPGLWGRLIESAVGAHLINFSREQNYEIYYYRERNMEVDFIVESGEKLLALEVKSGRTREKIPNLNQFLSKFKNVKSFLIGKDGLPLNDFFSINPIELF